MGCEYIGGTDIVERSRLLPLVVHFIPQDLLVFLSEDVQAVVRCQQMGLMSKYSGFVIRTFRILCDKSTLLQIGENVGQSALLRKDLHFGHEPVVGNTPQRVRQLGVCIAVWG